MIIFLSNCQILKIKSLTFIIISKVICQKKEVPFQKLDELVSFFEKIIHFILPTRTAILWQNNLFVYFQLIESLENLLFNIFIIDQMEKVRTLFDNILLIFLDHWKMMLLYEIFRIFMTKCKIVLNNLIDILQGNKHYTATKTSSLHHQRFWEEYENFMLQILFNYYQSFISVHLDFYTIFKNISFFKNWRISEMIFWMVTFKMIF